MFSGWWGRFTRCKVLTRSLSLVDLQVACSLVWTDCPAAARSLAGTSLLVVHYFTVLWSKHPQAQWIPCPCCLLAFSCIPWPAEGIWQQRANTLASSESAEMLDMIKSGSPQIGSLMLLQLLPVMIGNTLKKIQSREDDVLVVVVHFAVQQFFVWSCTKTSHCM